MVKIVKVLSGDLGFPIYCIIFHIRDLHISYSNECLDMSEDIPKTFDFGLQLFVGLISQFYVETEDN